ncbi:MAG: hypothetical protein LBI48_09690 [Burkholderiaceae bacterium]|nr:hypothetical protein [Burkholderiaceae bacterium]
MNGFVEYMIARGSMNYAGKQMNSIADSFREGAKDPIHYFINILKYLAIAIMMLFGFMYTIWDDPTWVWYINGGIITFFLLEYVAQKLDQLIHGDNPPSFILMLIGGSLYLIAVWSIILPLHPKGAWDNSGIVGRAFFLILFWAGFFAMYRFSLPYIVRWYRKKQYKQQTVQDIKKYFGHLSPEQFEQQIQQNPNEVAQIEADLAAQKLPSLKILAAQILQKAPA